MGLSKRHSAFIDEYFLCNMDATEAYLKVYPSSSYDAARASASRLLTNDNIREEINRRLTEKHMSADEVIARLAEQAKGISGKYLTTKGTIDFEKLIKDGKGYLVHRVKPTKFGPDVEFPNSQTALLNIGKQHGLFSDRHIIETRVEKELDSILQILEETLSPDDFNRIIARLSDSQASGPEMATEGNDNLA